MFYNFCIIGTVKKCVNKKHAKLFTINIINALRKKCVSNHLRYVQIEQHKIHALKNSLQTKKYNTKYASVTQTHIEKKKKILLHELCFANQKLIKQLYFQKIEYKSNIAV